MNEWILFTLDNILAITLLWSLAPNQPTRTRSQTGCNVCQSSVKYHNGDVWWANIAIFLTCDLPTLPMQSVDCDRCVGHPWLTALYICAFDVVRMFILKVLFGLIFCQEQQFIQVITPPPACVQTSGTQATTGHPQIDKWFANKE